MENNIVVEVAYLSPQHQIHMHLKLSEGATVKDALLQSGVTQLVDDITLEGTHCSHRLAIYGKFCTLDTVLSEGDRVDILRPLTVSAMEARKLRAKAQQSAA